MNKDDLNYNYYFDTLKKSIHFSEVEDNVLHEILLMFHNKKYLKDNYPFTTESTKYNFYFIVSGRVEVSKMNFNTGREYIINILVPGNIFDVIILLDNDEHDIIATALDDLELLVAPINIVREWLYKHPSFNKTLLPYLGKQLRYLEESASDLVLYDTWTRLVKLIIANTDKETGKLVLLNDLSHEQLAKMIGSARNVVNRHIQILKKNELLTVKNKFLKVINYQELLKELKNRL